MTMVARIEEKGPKYFEGKLQLRNPTPEVIKYVMGRHEPLLPVSGASPRARQNPREPSPALVAYEEVGGLVGPASGARFSPHSLSPNITTQTHGFSS